MKIEYQQISGIEPRFRVLKQELECLLRLVDLESNGKVVKTTGFRLKNLDSWRSDIGDNPLDIVGALSGICNCQCEFCFERAHPFIQDKSILSLEEATTRLRYYEPQSGKAIFPSSRVFKETFINPQALPILKLLRERSPDQVLWLTSNGSFLTEETIEQLAELKPLIIKLSLNSANPVIRSQLMGSNNRSETALRVPQELRRRGIPFIGSVVAWPNILADDLMSTLHYIDQYEPYSIRVRLPLYHRYLHAQPPFADDFWERVIELCREMQPKLASPLYVEPSLYWIKTIIPEIDGVIRNSPADAAHLHAGDQVVSINGEPVFTRTQALGLLVKSHSQDKSSLDLQIKRAGSITPEAITLKPCSAYYPFNPDLSAPNERYGILLLDDFRLQYIEDIRRLIEKHNSFLPMLFTSKVVEPIVRAVIENVPIFKEFFGERKLIIQVLEETALGGNFNLMDGRLVVDFINQIKNVQSRLGRLPDLILIPNAFGNPWGVDYFQESYKQIERFVDAPVELIDWPILYGRDV